VKLYTMNPLESSALGLSELLEKRFTLGDKAREHCWREQAIAQPIVTAEGYLGYGDVTPVFVNV
jgi:hypothetical protein